VCKRQSDSNIQR